ncbi:tyrosine-type recombinase/integrase [Mycobacteroides abscessus]|uniref:tyrosine-type recombinase/integrase n=1 Tax=Mycobacteroides abscessus TaxID=36809 RepID=UPI0009D019DC|nr:tyrosine-type recombinase/integrase [Mycobacteroides abscessus]SKQ83331.1 phage integrase family protein [Mycobacteroides abscessus subsp. massiliense]
MSAVLALAREPDEPQIRHVDRATYREWLWQHATPGSRYSGLYAYDAFVDRWPDLAAWRIAPLEQRMFDVDDPVPGENPHGGPRPCMPYLIYLSLVHGAQIDYPLLLARTFNSPFTAPDRAAGLGIDTALFASHVDRLVQLGYARSNALGALKWTFGRIALHRGDPDVTTIAENDLDKLYGAVDDYLDQISRSPELRNFGLRARDRDRSPETLAKEYRKSVRQQIKASHLLLFTIGQINTPPPRRVDAETWQTHLVPPGSPLKIGAIIERYLLLLLEGNTGRDQSVRHFRDALWRLARWTTKAHPEVTSFDQLTRAHAEEFLRWLGRQKNTSTGEPLVPATRRSIITLLMRFANDTSVWGWSDAPATVLFSRTDIPKIAKPVPRFIPDHELAALMAAVNELPNPYQRAALIIARWSGARRDEIRRLEVDCLDTYPGGHPRLRIPVGKTYTERSIPLHPDAAAALQPLIGAARTADARGQHDASSGRTARYVFAVRGKLLSNETLFDLSLKAACTAAGLVDSRGRQTITAHRFRHTIGTQLAEGGARLQTIMAVLGHKSPNMSIVYSSLSDPTVKQQYHEAITSRSGDEIVIAGPAAQALREHRLDPEAVSWLQTNFLKTELELGHCLRLPVEGPCECDLMLTCSKFLTTSDYAPRLHQRLAVEQQLIADAQERGWDREVERHQRVADTLASLLGDLHADS